MPFAIRSVRIRPTFEMLVSKPSSINLLAFFSLPQVFCSRLSGVTSSTSSGLRFDSRNAFGRVERTVGSFCQRYRLATGSFTAAAAYFALISLSRLYVYQRLTLQILSSSICFAGVLPFSTNFSRAHAVA